MSITFCISPRYIADNYYILGPNYISRTFAQVFYSGCFVSGAAPNNRYVHGCAGNV